MSNFLGFDRITKDDSHQYTEVFNNERSKVNAIRGYYLLFLGIIVEPFLIGIFDIPNIFMHGIAYQRTYLYLSLHLLLFVISIIGFIFCRRFRNKIESLTPSQLRLHDRLSYAIPFLYLASVAFINGLDQQTVESISVYTTFALIIGVFVIAHPKKTAILFGLSHICFIIGIIVYQDSPHIVVINIINGTIIILCAYVISILSYVSFFTNTKNNFLLNKANERFELLSNTDYLTNSYNKRYGIKRLSEYFSLSKRSNIPFGLLLIDLDDFKHINDTYGHILGDETLITVVDKIRKSLREEDIVIRYGGEEFLIILPNSTLEGVREVGNKLVKVIDDYLFDINGHQFRMTISIGGVSYPELKTDKIISLLEETDRLLYASKKSGKNQLTTH